MSLKRRLEHLERSDTSRFVSFWDVWDGTDGPLPVPLDQIDPCHRRLAEDWERIRKEPGRRCEDLIEEAIDQLAKQTADQLANQPEPNPEGE